MLKQTWHSIGRDLDDDAVAQIAAAGIAELEAYLAKHAKFDAYLLTQGRR